MAETAKALDSNCRTWFDGHLPHWVEDCQARAENWGVFHGWDVSRDCDARLGAENNILSICPVSYLSGPCTSKDDLHPPFFVKPLMSWLSHIW